LVTKENKVTQEWLDLLVKQVWMAVMVCLV